MISDLKPYPEYKETGLPWLGKAPGHWLVSRLGNFGIFSASGIDKKMVAGESLVRMINYLDIYKNSTHELWAKRQLMIVSCPADKKGVHSAMQGDMFFTPSSETTDDIGWSAVAMEDLPDTVYSYHVVRFRLQEPIDLFYKRYWCNNAFVLNQFSRASRGTTRKILDRGDFKRIVVLLPPKIEQVAIGRFLDWANGRLERAIRAKRKIIALLNEQKQAIIHRAVTGQIDVRTGKPYPAYKKSGVEWLGDIPEHWATIRAKYLYREIDDRSVDGSEELLSVSHITGVTPRSQKNVTMFKAASYAGHKLCEPNDLVVNTMWAWMGALGVSTIAGIISPSYAVYRPRRPECIIGAYMDGLLRSKPYVSNIICRSTGLRPSRLRLYPEEFFRLPIIQPPTEEQRRIVDAIQIETSDINAARDSLEREIKLLLEYRNRLISDVVTGKLDVRDVAAGLPEEATPDTADDAGFNEDTEISDEEAAV